MHETVITIPDDKTSEDARIKKLEKEVETMKVMHAIHMIILVLGVLGLTAGVMAKLSNIKSKFIK